MAHLNRYPAGIFIEAERWFDRSRAALLGEMPCRRGCSRCCTGLFPITILDAALLREGLEKSDASVRRDIEARATQQVAMIEQAYPTVAESPEVDTWREEDLDVVVGRFADLPCPALAPDGSCLLYAFRPVTCRMMGVPVEVEDHVHGACDVQMSVPIVRLPTTLLTQENQLAEMEETVLASLRNSNDQSGDELLLPYGFLPRSLPTVPSILDTA